MTVGITRAFAVLSLVAAGSGCTQGDCKAGTFRKGDTCYPYDPFDHTPPVITVSPPVRTRAVGTVTLSANKPATIYYTTDGSMSTASSASHADEVVIPDQPDNALVSFFAVDLAGNTSAVQTVSWIIDRTGPGVVLGMQVGVSGTTRTVSWTAPSDPHPGGVIVARVDGALDASPTPAARYAVGDAIGPGITVVALAPATATGAQSFTESRATPPGLVRYVAWAFDDLYNYGPATAAYQLVALPAQTPTVTASATGGVTVTTPAPNVDVSGSATLAGTTLSVALAITNRTNRPLFAPKVLLTTAPTGVTWSNSDGSFAGSPYRAYGAAILPGGTVTETWTFTGANATTTVTLPLDVRDGQVLLGPSFVFGGTATAASLVDATAGKCTTSNAPCSTTTDCATGQQCTAQSIAQLHGGPPGPNGRAGMRAGGITPDGRVVLGSRNTGQLTAFDLQSGFALRSNELLPQKANAPYVVLDAGGSSGYALVAFGHNFSQRNAGVHSFLVRFDAGSLVETGRIEIGQSSNRDLEISPDGKTLLVVTATTNNGILVVDLERFQVARQVATGIVAKSATFTPDGATIVAAALDGVHRYDLATGAELPSIQVLTGKIFHAAFAKDGKLWIGRSNDVLVVDTVAGTSTTFPFQSSTLVMLDGEAYVGREGSSQIVHLDNTGVAKKQLSFATSVYGHWMGRSPF